MRLKATLGVGPAADRLDKRSRLSLITLRLAWGGARACCAVLYPGTCIPGRCKDNGRCLGVGPAADRLEQNPRLSLIHIWPGAVFGTQASEPRRRRPCKVHDTYGTYKCLLRHCRKVADAVAQRPVASLGAAQRSGPVATSFHLRRHTATGDSRRRRQRRNRCIGGRGHSTRRLRRRQWGRRRRRGAAGAGGKRVAT